MTTAKVSEITAMVLTYWKKRRWFQTWALNPDSWEIHPGSQTAPASPSFCLSHCVAHLDAIQRVHQYVLKQCRKQQPQRVAAPLPVPSPVLYEVSANEPAPTQGKSQQTMASWVKRNTKLLHQSDSVMPSQGNAEWVRMLKISLQDRVQEPEEAGWRVTCCSESWNGLWDI